MSRYSSRNVGFLLIDGYSVLGTTTKLEDTHEGKIEETTPLGTAYETYEYVGLNSSELSQDGFFDDSANGSNDALIAGNGFSRLVCYGVEGNTIGKNFIGLSGALQTKYIRESKVGELHKAKAEYKGSGVKEDGKILHAHKVEITNT